MDSDESECFYAVEWLIPDFENNGDQPLVIAAGSSGVIKVINCAEERMTRTLMGHSDAVNDIVRHTTQDHIFFSASKDESIKMWNINTCICIASFAGDKGHREDVLSICVCSSSTPTLEFYSRTSKLEHKQVHDYGNCFASAGMDNTVKIWALDTELILKKTESSSKTSPRKTFQDC